MIVAKQQTDAAASSGSAGSVQDWAALEATVRDAVREQPVWDFHTHLYPPSFGTPLAGSAKGADPKGLMLWGIDELLTYHYLVAEVFRVVTPQQLPYDDFWRMTKSEQADHIWKHLFLERSPISEACRGVLTTLQRLGLDPADRDLAGYRKWFAEQDPDRHIDRVMALSGVSRITMTNAVSLAGKTSGALTFWRFVHANLDAGEYLKVEVYDGRAWVTVRNWTHGGGDDSVWRKETIDLNPYLGVAGFKVRFVYLADATDEHVNIEDVKIIAQ